MERYPDYMTQGGSIESARDNLKEAPEFFFETASSEEIQYRLHREFNKTHR
ncbi:hypothetical protein [Candidatus Magnetomonas plexicatena]|uniref:hypothetical protein n=1 Tax=Candidatus Magnetomonas plexicatena TaxID=2552947 RepID=UPI004032E4FB